MPTAVLMMPKEFRHDWPPVDLAAIELELEDLLKAPVHVTTDGALRGALRDRVLADAAPL